MSRKSAKQYAMEYGISEKNFKAYQRAYLNRQKSLSAFNKQYGTDFKMDKDNFITSLLKIKGDKNDGIEKATESLLKSNRRFKKEKYEEVLKNISNFALKMQDRNDDVYKAVTHVATHGTKAQMYKLDKVIKEQFDNKTSTIYKILRPTDLDKGEKTTDETEPDLNSDDVRELVDMIMKVMK